MKKKPLIVVAIIVAAGLLTLGGFIVLRPKKAAAPQQVVQNETVDATKGGGSDAPVTPEAPTTTPDTRPVSGWPVVYGTDEAASLTVVVNKKHKLPANYAPALVAVYGGQLRAEAAAALQELFAGAQAAGYSLDIISSYRSYATQESTYNGWVSQYGQAQADTFSARAGHSEHQTGLALDVGLANDSSYDLEQSFGQTPAGSWLAAHAFEYGFIIRYPEGKDTVTGYHYEPWHLRYLGKEVAAAVAASGKTLDEYYGVTAGDYQ